MSQTPEQVQAKLSFLRDEAWTALNRLRAAVEEACPGDHHMVQHRDKRPPWCPACGRDIDGRLLVPR